MNPLTLVKRIQSINSKEADLGISDEASWHAKYKDSAYVFVGGIPYDLTEGDLLAVFAQYGEVVDINLVRDKGTGKSKGFAFLAYEDQRSTTLAVDNLNGAQVLGRIIRVDHCSKYKKKEEEDEETERKNREARGVCRAFQRGECTRGASCKFSHDEQRAANTGWGHEEDKGTEWGPDKFEDAKKADKRYVDRGDFRSGDKNRNSRVKSESKEEMRHRRHDEDDKSNLQSKGIRDRGQEKERMRHRNHEHEPTSRDFDDRKEEKRSRRHDENDIEPKSRDDVARREEKRGKHIHDEADCRRDEKKLRSHGREHDRAVDTRSARDRESSYHRHGARDDRHRQRDR